MKKIVIIMMLLIFFRFFSFSQDQHKIDSLKKILQKTKQDTIRAKILFQLCLAYVENDFNKANDYAMQSLSLSEKIGYKRGVGDVYFALAGIEITKGNYSKAMELYEKCRPIMLEIGNKYGIALAYYNTGVIYKRLGNYPDAIKNLSSALKTFMENGNRKEVADVDLTTGQIYKNQGIYPEALKNYLAALNVYESLDDQNRIAMSYQNIVSVYLEQGNFPEALKNCYAGLKIFQKTGHKAGIVGSYNSLGSIYYKQGNLSEALKSFFVVLKYSLEFGLKNTIAAAYANIGCIYDDQGNYTKALENFLAGLKIVEELGQQEEIATSFLNIGISYLRQKNFSAASKYLNRALSLSKEISSRETICTCYEYLAKVDSAQGNYKRALEYFKLYVTAKESLTNEENIRKMVQLQMQYEFDKKDALTQKELQNQKYKLALTKILSGSIGGFVLLVLLVVLLWLQRKRFRSERKALVLEQKLLRSQMNPHFLFNSLTNIQNFFLTERSDKATLYLSKFANLVRNILDNSREEFIPLQKEIETIEYYLDLQKIRYSGKFDSRIHIADEIDPEMMKVPPMLAQPFIENSIEHGIRHRETPGFIDIRFSMKDHLLVFEVEDNGVGREKAREIAIQLNPQHKSLATSLTRERLVNLNRKLKEKIFLEIIDLKNSLGEASGTMVRFGIPVGR